MIVGIEGAIEYKDPSLVHLNVHGLVYEVFISLHSYGAISSDRVKLFTSHIIREDAQLLYGFYSEPERFLFKSLIKVNGVGPKLALTILSGISANEFVQVVKNNDESGLVRLPGIGKKTAQRLIVEMKDRLNDWQGDEALEQDKSSTGANNLNSEQDIIKEATSALIALGYKPVEASKMISTLDKQDQNSQSLIKQALKNTVR